MEDHRGKAPPHCYHISTVGSTNWRGMFSVALWEDIPMWVRTKEWDVLHLRVRGGSRDLHM